MGCFLCPVCGKELLQEEKAWRCAGGRHSFDKAKSGYVNLLLANAKHSADPGDNKLMVNARRSFLEAGYYGPLQEELRRMAEEYLAPAAGWVLDIGCGEGYYTQALCEAAAGKTNASCETPVQVAGVDISRLALDKAAKRCKQAFFAVASAYHLPVRSGCCDMAVNLFAPWCGEEIARVLCPGGVLLLAVPGRDHLWELKAAVYERPYPNEVKEFTLQGFTLLEHQRLHYRIALNSREDIEHLFQMTPYYYKTSQQDYARLQTLENLKTQVEFHLLAYRKG